MKRYRVTGYCRDCTDEDPKGCNDGEPWELGDYAEKADAEEVAKNHSDMCAPWYAEIEEVEVEKDPDWMEALIKTIKKTHDLGKELDSKYPE
jgi:hypothetical protein